jgi:hypothetical protein
MCFGRQAAILARRERIKRRALQQRKRENLHTPHHGPFARQLFGLSFFWANAIILAFAPFSRFGAFLREARLP